MQGHTLQDLDIRHSYGVTVVAINRVGKLGESAALKNLKEVFEKGEFAEKQR